jgi:putative addiction module killer protein
MIEIRKTDVFAQWLDGLRDIHARARIQTRIERLAAGNAGDVKRVGEGVSELRIDYGPGYRVYFTNAGLRWLFYWRVVTRALKPAISKPPCASHVNCRSIR